MNSKLTGCVSISRHISDHYGRIIYIIGEDHNAIYNTDVTCKSVDEWISEVISNTKYIDIFVETPYAGSDFETTYFDKLPDKNSGLGKIYKRFKHCLVSKKSDCSQARFHYTDIRNHPHPLVEELQKIYQEQLSITQSLLSSTHNFEEWAEDLRVLWLYFADKSFYQLDRVSKAQKQLENISSFSTRRKIDKFIQAKRSQNMITEKQVNQLCDRWVDWSRDSRYVRLEEPQSLWTADWQKNPNITKKMEFFDLVEQTDIFLVKILELGGSLMDKYLLGRLFRDDIGTNIIIYAGEAHCETYRHMLDILDFHVDFFSNVESKNNKVDCVDISEIPSPMFE